ncbi:MAG TPA: PilZ domain-containing protein [Steroidobacteraceae bacterium]|nr:PilZ domain-containing protein [Steroidobacteraceae bacterium]
MYEGVDTVVLHNELAYEDVLPVGWRPLAKPLDLTAVTVLTERNVRTLQVCATIEEQGPVEKAEDKSMHSTDLLRLETKMNLVLELMGQLLAAQQPRPKAAPVKFNALGAVWRSQAPPKQGEQGLLDIYLRECLAQPLTLIASVTQVSNDGQVKVAFTPPGEATADLIEKLAFRRHRRHVAGVRQPRRSPGETGITRIIG